MLVVEIHVAVAVIMNSANEVLISLRPESSHQGGLWEFPGGKLEKGESVFTALKREISEELGINVLEATPFKVIRHSYTDKVVVLDVWKVMSFSGEPRGVEGQKIKWIALEHLKAKDFPAANASIIESLQLPDKYMITGGFSNSNDFAARLRASLESGISIVQLRNKDCTTFEFLKLTTEAQKICSIYNARLLLNTDLATFNQTSASGLHLSSQRLYEYQSRPITKSLILSASCHTVADIEQARKLQANILLVSPVKKTTSHPGVDGIGWSGFSQLIRNCEIPVYALGGMKAEDIGEAKLSGAQGVAAISSFWVES